MQEEFEEKLKDLIKEYNIFIWGRHASISYDESTDSLDVEGLLIEVKGGD